MVMHLYCNYSLDPHDNDKHWRHSHYCWCRRESGKRISLDSQKLDMMDYAYFDMEAGVLERFPVEEPKTIFSAEAEVVLEKHMRFYVSGRDSTDALAKAKEYVKKQYPDVRNRNIQRISVTGEE